MKPEIKVKKLEMADPTFTCGTLHVAVAKVTNPTSGTFTYHFALSLVDPVTGSIGASATEDARIGAGGTQTLGFQVTMPDVEKTWDVRLDVSVEGEPIDAYKADEQVTTVKAAVTPEIEVISLTWE